MSMLGRALPTQQSAHRVASAAQPCSLSATQPRQQAYAQYKATAAWQQQRPTAAGLRRRAVVASAAEEAGATGFDPKSIYDPLFHGGADTNVVKEDSAKGTRGAGQAEATGLDPKSIYDPLFHGGADTKAGGGETPLKKSASKGRSEAPKAGTGAGLGTSGSSSATATAPPPPPQSEGPSAEETKTVLLDSLYGTERGLSVSSELRGEISELITQLEAANPSDAPNGADKLSGEWKLVYTSNSELTALLALAKLPFVTVGDITQTIDGAAGTVVNKVNLMDSISRTAFSSTANFDVRSSKLLNIRFVRGALATPQLLTDVDIPESVSVLGQTVDLRALRDALAPARRSLQDAVSQAASFLSQQPDLSFDIPERARQESWLLTTYLDEDMRIARGDGGSVFVLVKEPGAAATAAGGHSNAAAAQNGNGAGGAWKDDPLRNGYTPPPPVTPPAMNVEPQLRGEGDLSSY